ncbi:MAG: DUF2306 domain-containing protein [Chloroflexi bacterium]|nr:DUF2306 domain-containing protein [Ardenticatenaceae bacterium]MBL1128992.1 DUF2306 domain-containing protein [Chloroflexota bacterium]NOG35070.1 DUF2306 domain-containing protein [Chloroflexota bacterium]
MNRTEWLVPIGLILLSLVPVLAGAARIAELSGGAEITPDNARFFASPLPVVVHILSVTIYALLGAFQFAPSLRRRKPKWHRTAGRILVPAGLAAALSGLWMTLFYALPESDGALLNMMRLVFGSAMLLSIILGVTAVRQRDFPRHGDWMMHGYAIGLGAGTQVLTHLPWFLLFGVPDEFTKAMLMGAGWVINLAVAEWVIRKRRARYGRSRRAPTVSL